MATQVQVRTLIETVAEGDIAWFAAGNCHRTRRTEGMEDAWLLRRNDAGYDHRKDKIAQGLCVICPVQWQCCALAMFEDRRFCTYAVTPNGRKILREHDWQSLLVEAEAESIPVASIVSRLQGGVSRIQ